MKKIARLDAIPARLKNRDQWVLWRYVTRDSKRTKVPCQTNGELASVTDPTTWTTFEKVIAAFQRGGFDGIGYVFSADDPYSGIDLDSCRDRKTGNVARWAQRIIDRLASYTEISPSGKGLHIIVRGELPEGGNKRDQLEIYDRERFFCMTGDHLDGTPREIKTRRNRWRSTHATPARPTCPRPARGSPQDSSR